ncbi:hypothetical protein H4582DRAFT_2079310 [Lactarius indigo]|nr:hypothetical protein H4582DRAFT_2079310 [Lactarius indigo]
MLNTSVKVDQRRIFTYKNPPPKLLIPTMASTNPSLDLNLYMCAASLGSPMVALVLVPPDISRVNIFICPPTQQVVDVDATPCRALTEPTPPQAAIQTSGNTPKHPRNPMGEQTEHPPAKQAKVEGGPSHLQVTGHPQQVAGGDDLLVLPPILKDIYDELISSYEFIVSSYNDLISLAMEPETSEDEQEKHCEKTTRQKLDDDKNPFADCGRFLMRCVYPFIVVDTLVVVAQELTSLGCTDKYEYLTEEIKERYEDYAAAALDFSEDLRMHLSWGDTCVPDIGRAIVRGMRISHSSDIHRLKTNTRRLASKTDTPLALAGDTKSDRGFTNDALGRMLIPIQHLKAYTDDPVETKVKNGLVGYKVTGGDPPAFLYEDPENYDPTNLLSRFMRGYFLPRGQGRQFKKVTVPIIVYVAMLAQFTLSSQPAWSGQDGKFNYQDFADMLFQVFKQDDKWTDETIWWWNVELFGNENGLRSAGSAKGATSRFLEKVKDQSKDRRAEKEVEEEVPKQMSVEEPGPWDKDDSELTDTTDAGRNDPSDTLPSPSSPRSQTAGAH